MIGCKPLTDQEIAKMLKVLQSERNRCYFILGLRSGFRVSELLSLSISDCFQYGQVVDRVTVRRSNMKGKQSSRTVVLHDEAKQALKGYLDTLNSTQEDFQKLKLFPFGRVQAHRLIHGAAEKAQVQGKVSNHSMRKTFCKKIYHALEKDLVGTQKAIGHKSIGSTVSYLSFEQSEIDSAILKT